MTENRLVGLVEDEIAFVWSEEAIRRVDTRVVLDENAPICTLLDDRKAMSGIAIGKSKTAKDDVDVTCWVAPHDVGRARERWLICTACREGLDAAIANERPHFGTRERVRCEYTSSIYLVAENLSWIE
jgi:hypothetical protein